MNRILIDLSYITSEQKARESVAIYAFRFLDTIPDDRTCKFDLLVSEEMWQYFSDRFPQFKCIKYPALNPFFKSIPYVKGVIKMVLWKKFVDQLDYDAIYIPFSWSGNSLKSHIRKIITIHDLRPMRQTGRVFSTSKWFNALGLKSIYLKCSRYFYTRHCKNASKIIGISEYISDDIKTEWPHFSSKVTTVYNGVSLKTTNKTPIKSIENVDYILYVNTLAKYKNIITLIRAFAQIKDRFPDYRLVVVGKPTDYWKTEVSNEIDRLGIADRIISLQYLSDEELIWAYSNARLFVTTSIHEGFGYTPIEAAICGSPVISSCSDSLPDVTAGKVTYYDPVTSDSMLAEKMTGVLLNPPSSENLNDISAFFKERYNQHNQSNKILDCILSTVTL